MSSKIIPFRKILVAMDHSDQASWALDLAILLARASGATLDVVHVVRPPFGPPDYPYIDTTERVEMHLHAEQLLVNIRGRIPSDIYVDTLLREGEPAKQIVATARDRDADLIVLGTHGRGPVAHLLLGSTAEAVVRHAPCPVLTTGHPSKEPLVTTLKDVSQGRPSVSVAEQAVGASS